VSEDLSRRYAKFGLLHEQIIRIYPKFNHGAASLAQNQVKDSLRIGFVGGTSASKGLHILAEALSYVDRPWRLEIFNIRKDKSKKRILQMFKGQEGKISLSGPFEPNQLDEIFSNLDVLVVPSIWPETYSRVVDEALARNLIVVASNVGGMVERLVDGVNAFVAETGNPKSFAQKISYIIDNSDEIRKTLRFDFLRPETDNCGVKILKICSAFAQGKFRNGYLFDHQDEIDCISKITGMPRDNVEQRLLEELKNPGRTVNVAWLAAGPPKDDFEIADFYRTSDAYLYDLIVAHESWERNQWRIAALSAIHRLNCKSVLDYGGGIGRDSIFFAKAGLDVAYFEVNEYLRQFTEYTANKQKVRIHFTNDAPSLRDETFDAVYCTEVLEHVPNPLRELRQMYRLLKPAGTLIATESFGSIGERFLTHLPKHATYAGRLSSLAGQVGFVLREILPTPSNRMYVFRRLDRSASYTATTSR
jgi:SAM-dependent methyltransferase